MLHGILRMISVLPRGSRFDPLDVADRELAASFDALVQQMFAIGLELHAAAALINGNDRAAARIQGAVRGLDHMINDTRRTAAAHSTVADGRPERVRP